MAKKKTNQTSSEKKRKHESPLLSAQQDDKPIGKDRKQRRESKSSKSKKALKEELEERRLTALLFGDSVEHVEEEEIEAPPAPVEEDQFMFEIDRTGAEHSDDEDEEEEPSNTNEEGEEHSATSEADSIEDDDDNEKEEGPAWIDEDDDEVQVDLLKTARLRKLRKNKSEEDPLRGSELQKRLRARYKDTMQNTAQTQWARLDDDGKDEDRDDEDEDTAAVLQSSSQPLLLQGASSSSRLPPNILNVMRCPDANQSDYNKAVVQAANFHPGSDPEKPLLLTAGLDKTLRFFQVSAEKSEKIHGIHCE